MEVMRVGRGARWMAERKARLRLLSISCLDTIMPVAPRVTKVAVHSPAHDPSSRGSPCPGGFHPGLHCGAPSVSSPFLVNDAGRSMLCFAVRCGAVLCRVRDRSGQWKRGWQTVNSLVPGSFRPTPQKAEARSMPWLGPPSQPGMSTIRRTARPASSTLLLYVTSRTHR
jgi:hypothetical protein